MTFREFVDSIVGGINGVIVPLIITFAFLVFIYGIVQYFFIGGSEPANRAKGRNFILWGAIGLALIFAVWALVRILLSTLGILSS
jgi:hypothetical protein